MSDSSNTPTHIVFLQRLKQNHIDAIASVLPDARITQTDLQGASEFIEDADVLVAWGSHDISHLIGHAPKLKWVHALSAGVEKLLPALVNTDIALTNSRGAHQSTVAEHVLSLILALNRGLYHHILNQKQGVWKRVPTFELSHQTLGIIGLGAIGLAVSKRAKALGMKVIAIKRTPEKELFIDHLYSMDELPHFLGECDHVVIALPLTPETSGLFGATQFSQMKPSACLINIARGPIVQEQALIDALTNGTIRGAGLDVFDTEPLPPEHPLWQAPNLIITPHSAALSPEFLNRSVQFFCNMLAYFLEGKTLPNSVDKTKGY